MKSILFYISFLCALVSFSQVRKPFTQRTSQKLQDPYIKGQTNYSIKGDFNFIGNTIVKPAPTANTSKLDNNENIMEYVNVDNSNGNFNSSTATLRFIDNNKQTINNGCTKVVYAGLYWTGRVYKMDKYYNPDKEQEISQVYEQHLKYNKKEVKLKHENSSYQTIQANANDIYYPTSTAQGEDIYVAYADITDIVREKGAGKYTVANIATTAHSTLTADGYGSFGGWGMVVVYENPQMKLKDISIFDGFVYYKANDNGIEKNKILDINGFLTPPSGDVNA